MAISIKFVNGQRVFLETKLVVSMSEGFITSDEPVCGLKKCPCVYLHMMNGSQLTIPDPNETLYDLITNNRDYFDGDIEVEVST